MKTIETMDINPKDIGRHIFAEGWYEGELSLVAISEYEEGDAMVTQGYRQAGDRELLLRGTLETNEGRRGLDENLAFQGGGAFKARGALQALKIKEGTSLADNPFKGAKVRVEFGEPRTTEKGTYNNFKRLSVVS